MLSAALEELEHTRITASLARSFGGSPTVPSVQERPLRSLLATAIDNAVEGCVRETFGALVAQYQALHAGNDQVRVAMTGIAVDETRHAELSWALDQWINGELSVEEQIVVRAARSEAVAQLRRELEAPVDPVLVREAGMPTAEIALRMFGELRSSLAC